MEVAPKFCNIQMYYIYRFHQIDTVPALMNDQFQQRLQSELDFEYKDLPAAMVRP